ncbi:MAG: HD-GYP domain-containing protein [Phycisphaerae bacterium]
MKILIADHKLDADSTLPQALLRGGFETVIAESGYEALDLLGSQSMRLVLIGSDLPDMSGSDLCRAVRLCEQSSYVYLILVNSGSAAEAVGAFEAGADDVIGAAHSDQELIARLRAGQRVLSLETQDLVLFSMAKLAESRDPETGAHLERVRNFSRVIALHLSRQPEFEAGISFEYVRLLEQTSPLHDIGKVAIPDCVLLKPGRLTDAEFEVMKTHTTIAAETLQAALDQYPNARYLQMASDIAENHHEKWDGSGYPNGKAGSSIPLSARIVALADAYDAMTSRRVYKGAFPHEKTRDIIACDAGTHFDPTVVEAFLACESVFIEIRDQYADDLPCPQSAGA